MSRIVTVRALGGHTLVGFPPAPSFVSKAFSDMASFFGMAHVPNLSGRRALCAGYLVQVIRTCRVPALRQAVQQIASTVAFRT
jgi:hypothetical protein